MLNSTNLFSYVGEIEWRVIQNAIYGNYHELRSRWKRVLERDEVLKIGPTALMHIERIARQNGDDLSRFKYVHLVRSNLWQQATSIFIDQRKTYTNDERGPDTIDLDEKRIKNIYLELYVGNKKIDQWFKSNRVECFLVIYEELMGNPIEIVKKIITHFGYDDRCVVENFEIEHERTTRTIEFAKMLEKKYGL